MVVKGRTRVKLGFHGKRFNPLPDEKKLDSSKLKQIADDILNSNKNEK